MGEWGPAETRELLDLLAKLAEGRARPAVCTLQAQGRLVGYRALHGNKGSLEAAISLARAAFTTGGGVELSPHITEHPLPDHVVAHGGAAVCFYDNEGIVGVVGLSGIPSRQAAEFLRGLAVLRGYGFQAD